MPGPTPSSYCPSMAEATKDTTLAGALRRAAAIGLVLGTVVVVVLLLLDSSDLDVVVWGSSLLLGVLGTLAGLVFAGMTRVVGRGEGRALGEQHRTEHFLPEAVRLERSFLYVGVPLLVTGVLLSASLLLQGESLI